jgi:phosphonate transport system substrate-binding protein
MRNSLGMDNVIYIIEILFGLDGKKRACHLFSPASVMPLITFLLYLAIFLTPEPSHAGDKDDMPKVLRSGFVMKVIADVDPRDAQVTLELLTNRIARNLALDTLAKVVIYPDMKKLMDAVRHQELEVISMPAIEFLRLRDKSELIPSFVSMHTDGTGLHFILITRNDSGIRSVADLKGKTVLGISADKLEVGHVWLECLLLKEVQEAPATFLRQFKETKKQSQAIMGVFFRQADAALVTRAGLDSAKMLNPQIERQLRVIAESSELSDSISCFQAKLSGKVRSALINAVLKITNDTSGRQLLTIVQSSGITPFKPSHFAGLEELLREQNLLKIKFAKKR